MKKACNFDFCTPNAYLCFFKKTTADKKPNSIIVPTINRMLVELEIIESPIL